MELLNKYQSRVFQFALELLARLEARGSLEEAAVNDLALRRGLDYGSQVLDPLLAAGVLVREDRSVRLAPGLTPPRLPMSCLEKQFLSQALRLPEASLFLDPETRSTLEAACGEEALLAAVQRYAPQGEDWRDRIAGEDFRTLLTAIRRRERIVYRYRTREDQTLRQGETLPWKLEYSAYDRRWWVILYDREQDRTIKARLDNLQDIRRAGPGGVPPEAIEAAMDRLLEPEPIVLEVRRTLGTLERCFLVFENQIIQETRQLSGDRFRLVFRWYRFDREELLRRLLYLGPAVTLIRPAALRQELRELVEQALQTQFPAK